MILQQGCTSGDSLALLESVAASAPEVVATPLTNAVTDLYRMAASAQRTPRRGSKRSTAPSITSTSGEYLRGHSMPERGRLVCPRPAGTALIAEGSARIAEASGRLRCAGTTLPPN